MIYENKDILIANVTIEEMLFDIGTARADLERKDLSGMSYEALKQIAIDLETAFSLIDKHIEGLQC